jgi:hypothetical protein
MRFARVCAAVLLALSVAACGSGDDAAAPPPVPTFVNWPETLDGLRFRWAAEPGIDLLSGPAVPLRAYLESHRLGDFTSNTDDAYPGFKRAVQSAGKPIDQPSSTLPFQLWNIQPATDPALAYPQPTRFYGNEYFHVLDLTPIDSGGYRAHVCDGLYNVFRESADSHEFLPVYVPTVDLPDIDRFATQVWRVELTDAPPPPTGAPPAVLGPQQGPNPAPIGDVFGPWRITGASPNTSWGATDRSDPEAGPDPATPQLRERCRNLMPHDAAQRQAIYATRLSTPPVPEPAIPGWPGNDA